MKKEIYIIKNKINKKVYIGQSVNSAIRWSAHKSAAKSKIKKITIDKAMAELGVENFWYEVIETTENYDEREIYWINYYNSIIPNGYNLLLGGDGAQIGVNSANAIIRDKDILNALMDDLSFTDIKMIDLAEKYGVSKSVISSINRGKSYYDESRIYPLRRRDSDNLDKLNYNEIIKDLSNTNLSLRELSKKYKINTFIIRQINSGEIFFNKELIYPLRKNNNDKIEKIKTLLSTTTLSMREIGRLCDISSSMVIYINKGKYYYDATINYPIRK